MAAVAEVMAGAKAEAVSVVAVVWRGLRQGMHNYAACATGAMAAAEARDDV